MAESRLGGADYSDGSIASAGDFSGLEIVIAAESSVGHRLQGIPQPAHFQTAFKAYWRRGRQRCSAKTIPLSRRGCAGIVVIWLDGGDQSSC